MTDYTAKGRGPSFGMYASFLSPHESQAMTTAEINAKNLGPITNFMGKLEGYGISVVSGSNGQGKSILLDSLQNLASGTNKFPLQYGQRKGELAAFGAVATIGPRVKKNGEFDIVSIQGRLDLATFVDPGIKDPEKADKARIRALGSIVNIEPNVAMFSDRPEFIDFADVVGDELPSDDLPEAAAKVKRLYEKEARTREDAAERASGQAQGYRTQIDGIDVEEEADLEAARKAHLEAVSELSRLEQSRRSYEEHEAERAKSRERLAEIKASRKGPSVGELTGRIAEEAGAVTAKQEHVRQLEDQLRVANEELANAVSTLEDTRREYEAATQREREIAELEEALKSDAVAPVSEAHVEDAREAVSKADAEYNRVRTLIDAKELAKRAVEHEATADHHREQAEKLRTAAKATEKVLADAIQCDSVRIEIDGDTTALVVNHPVYGNVVRFAELSAGQRWKIAIDLAVKTVGEGGLIVIPQEAFEGLDGNNTKIIDDYAVEKKVFILTAEAPKTVNRDENGNLVVHPFAMRLWRAAA